MTAYQHTKKERCVDGAIRCGVTVSDFLTKGNRIREYSHSTDYVLTLFIRISNPF